MALNYENTQIFTAVFNFHGISHAFQYTTIKIVIFCPFKNLLNNKKLKRMPKSLC